MINYRGLTIPHTQLGINVTSDNLFDPNEQIIFDFYEANYGRYLRALDIGANIGVHSILMARCGWEVRAYEPDPDHYARLQENVASHGVAVTLTRAAVAERAGQAQFVRVLGNTTGSHLAGAKKSYGPRVQFPVDLVDCRQLFAWADFAKIDCEGQEAALICTTTAETWMGMDAMLEVGSTANMHAIYNHLRDLVPMWAQKIEWGRVWRPDDMPSHHSEGSLFVGIFPPFLKKV